MKHHSLIAQMTLEEKVALCSGADAFTTKALDRLGIPALVMADGPHGLRKQVATANPLGINASVPATCFPAASLSACSWDRELLCELGAALGEEALQEGVDVVLGPGANIKRNPLCGRNFEYFSEDPYLAGELAAGWVRGVQGRGVAASLKHFAANNQESERMASDSLVDERTLREVYLPAFEAVVQAARPATVMCAYNKLNGVYCSDNAGLLRDILRGEWGFSGVVVTDWGAMHDRVAAFEAGLDLEMPGSQGYFDADVIEAVRTGRLAEDRIEECVDRLLDLADASAAQRRPGYRYDVDAHHALAQKIAVQSAVLLKNADGVLPLKAGQQVALIGALAETPRYQGAGSSHINPTRLVSARAAFDALDVAYTYVPGYPLDGPAESAPVGGALLTQAVAAAHDADVAVIFAGLTEAYESEGFDRTTLALPSAQDALIEAVAAANANVVVVLAGGAPVEMPWLPHVKAVLHMYLAGQAGGQAAAELLTGHANPSGKLAESYPLRYANVPSAGLYETGGKQAQYREGLYVGYRYYDKAGQAVLFPFGHGLSYTSFAYENLVLSQTELVAPYDLRVTATIRNTGNLPGAEVVQLYVGQVGADLHRPVRELRGFAKVRLEPGETQAVGFMLDARAFACWDPRVHAWVVPDGAYRISLGASSRDLRLEAGMRVYGGRETPVTRPVSAWYRQPAGAPAQADFEALLGRQIEAAAPLRKGAYTLDCSFQDMQGSFVVRQIIRSIGKRIAAGFSGADDSNPTYKMMLATALTMPLRSVSLNSPGEMPRHVTEGIVHLANGHYWRGIRAFTRQTKTQEK